jgi:tetratricopeptide (TPR) repeat protein
MKKTALTTLILLFFLFTSLPAQTNSPDEAYVKAVTTPDPAKKAQLLKDYIKAYGGKGTQYENFAYASLCLLPYQGKTQRETIDYGEKALTLGGLDDLTQCQVLLTLSTLYISLGQNLVKAKDYASQVIRTAQASKGKEDSPATPTQWNQLIGAAYYTQGQAQEKIKDYSGATDSYINSYKILKNEQIAKELRRLGKILYDGKAYSSAEKALEIAADALKDTTSIYLYAKSLHRTGKKEQALSRYKQAYLKQKSGELAYNIAIILAEKAKKNPSFSNEALDYLLDASFLSASHSKQAMQMAESLFFHTRKDLNFNENVKELLETNTQLEQLTESFNTKFGEKDEEDLSAAEKKEMESILAKIEDAQQTIERLKADQEAALEEFKKQIEKSKQRLGIS